MSKPTVVTLGQSEETKCKTTLASLVRKPNVVDEGNAVKRPLYRRASLVAISHSYYSNFQKQRRRTGSFHEDQVRRDQPKLIDAPEDVLLESTASPKLAGVSSNFLIAPPTSPIDFKKCRKMARKHELQLMARRDFSHALFFGNSEGRCFGIALACRPNPAGPIRRWFRNLSNQSPWTKLAIFVCLLLLLVQCVATFAPSWTYFEDPKLSAYAGLFVIYFRHLSSSVQTYSFTGYYNFYHTLWTPLEVLSEWMWISRFMAILAILSPLVALLILLHHSFTTPTYKESSEESDQSNEKWLLTKEYAILLALFGCTFFSFLAVMFWHGASCDICAWVRHVAVASSYNGQEVVFKKSIYDSKIALRWRLANALPNQVQKETVYIGHGAGRNDEESNAVGYNAAARAENLVKSDDFAADGDMTQNSNDSMHHAIHGTVAEEQAREQQLKEGSVNSKSFRDLSHVNLTCYANWSVWLILACFFLNIPFLVLLLTVTKGHFLIYSTYDIE